MSKKAYQCTGLTDGLFSSDSLDSIDGDILNNGDFCFVFYNNNFYVYYLDAESGETPDNVNIISPITNAGDKRWIKQHCYPNADTIVQVLDSIGSVTIDWALGSTAEITLASDETDFTFTGAYNGQRCILIIKQYSGIGTVIFGSEVRAGTDLTSPPTITETDGKKDYLGYIYNGTDSKYDFVSLAQGF